MNSARSTWGAERAYCKVCADAVCNQQERIESAFLRFKERWEFLPRLSRILRAVIESDDIVSESGEQGTVVLGLSGISAYPVYIYRKFFHSVSSDRCTSFDYLPRTFDLPKDR